MKQKGNIKKEILMGVGGLIILAVIALIVNVSKKPDQNQTNQDVVSGTSAKRTDLALDQIPTGFPMEFIITDNGARITQSYETRQANRIQSTRAFESKRSVKNNFSFFKDIIEKNGWKLDKETQSNQLSSLFASRGEGTLVINISQPATESPVTVEISYIREQ